MVSESFKQSVYDSFSQYLGKSVTELERHFLIDSKSKSYLEIITSRILGYKSKVNQSIEMIRSNVIVKTIKIQQNGSIKESMSFPTFNFKEIVEEKWKDCQLRNMFLTQTFLFVTYVDFGNDIKLSSVNFWSMPIETIEQDVRKVWEKTVEVLKTGNIVAGIKVQKNGKSILKTNFPGASFNPVCHVRPHAQNASDCYDLPVPDKLTGIVKFTKQCFWLNNTYIRKILE